MNNNQIVLPLDIGVLIPKTAPVRTLHYITERLDYSCLNSLYYKGGAMKTYLPKLLFQIVLLGYMNHIFSSRNIEKSCKKDITFMWLLQGSKAPDHNTINRFRQEVGEVLDDLFAQFIQYLITIDEVKLDHVFIDGTKLESFANKYTFVWKKSTSKNDKKMMMKIESSIVTLNKTYGFNFKYTEHNQAALLDDILTELCLLKETKGIVFVHGKGKRKEQIQRDIELFEGYLTRRIKYDQYYVQLGDRNSFSKTDPDATFMHMKEDHMRNSQLKPGYNVQAAASGGYCVGVSIYTERNDQRTLLPFLTYLEETIRLKFNDIVADAGYESEENYSYLEKNNQISYIKPSNYERSKKRNYKNKINLRENMEYDSEKDVYICKNNRVLSVTGKIKRVSKSGYVSDIKIYTCESCENCKFKKKCTRAQDERQLHVSEEFIRLRNSSTDNITTDFGKRLRMNRSIQIEGLFGVLKEDYGFRRFLTKGKKNVSAEIKLLMFALNLNKLSSRIERNKLGFKFYSLKAG